MQYNSENVQNKKNRWWSSWESFCIEEYSIEISIRTSFSPALDLIHHFSSSLQHLHYSLQTSLNLQQQDPIFKMQFTTIVIGTLLAALQATATPVVARNNGGGGDGGSGGSSTSCSNGDAYCCTGDALIALSCVLDILSSCDQQICCNNVGSGVSFPEDWEYL